MRTCRCRRLRWWCSTAGAWRRTVPATRSRLPTPRCSTSCGASTRTRSWAPPAAGRPAGRPDGQLRGRAPQPRRGLRHQAGPGAHRRRDRAGSFFQNEALARACAAAREHGGRCTCSGSSPAAECIRAWITCGVHRAGGARARAGAGAARVHRRPRHLPTSAPAFLAEAERWLAEAPGAGTRPASARSGALLGDGPRQPLGPDEARLRRARPGEGLRAPTAQDAVEQAYERGETDEFIQPTIVGEPRPLRDGDSVITFNFRPDRMRQLVRALGEPNFEEFDRAASRVVHLTTMTRYREDWDYPVAFEARPEITIARLLAERGDRQLHVAETEKYPHVTYFFNGGEEDPYPGEERALVPSPRDVPTYDHKPEMSARGAAASSSPLARGGRGRGGRFGSGSSTSRTRTWSATPADIAAATRAVETVDRCLGDVAGVSRRGRRCIVTADHGNADEMLTPTAAPRPPTPPTRCRCRDRARPRACRPGHPRRRGPDRPRAARHSAAGGDDRPLVAGRSRADDLAAVPSRPRSARGGRRSGPGRVRARPARSPGCRCR